MKKSYTNKKNQYHLSSIYNDGHKRPTLRCRATNQQRKSAHRSISLNRITSKLNDSYEYLRKQMKKSISTQHINNRKVLTFIELSWNKLLNILRKGDELGHQNDYTQMERPEEVMLSQNLRHLKTYLCIANEIIQLKSKITSKQRHLTLKEVQIYSLGKHQNHLLYESF